MAKCLVQIVMMRVQIVGLGLHLDLLAKVCSQLASSRCLGMCQSSSTSNLSSISLQEAQQGPNISKLSFKKVQNNSEYLFTVNDKSMCGSFYL
ncbi:hypothetical protein P7K49_028422 [Saguinus oedipus]|uniref:Uncharacterized protein n=1 Tax=Saguinus oedipus TaxID=9490 RepID=A0ABQ9UC89_SAGOE|nr:hypothetical protein P7K49_028422 [Saguinus oedipus]